MTKLRPDRDLQCYFERPSAAAALSGASASGFTISGCWRQQFDWAVVEWNRDNVFEHPLLRNLPDGNLSGITLSYEEARTNCVALDSTLYPTVDWPYLRIWTETSGADPYRVRLKDYATPVEGGYGAATIEFELQGTPSAGDIIELAWSDQHFNYQLKGTDTLATAAGALAGIIAGFAGTSGVDATASGGRITLSYSASAGSNANRIGVYATVHGAGTETWSPGAGLFSGGTSPSRWRIALSFADLRDVNGAVVPMTNVRKMRWTWAADLRAASFVRSEFAVVVSNWTVGGSGTGYQVAGPGSRRIEDDAVDVRYQGAWTEARGNYSGGSIRWTSTPGSSVAITYTANGSHTLLVGTRRADSGASVSVQVDGAGAAPLDLHLAGEDVLVRLSVGQLPAGTHTVTMSHAGAGGTNFYFDFLEIAYPASNLPELPVSSATTLATDWDTDHSIALAAERTAWIVQKLGFRGRANHYVGALWFYELTRPGHNYASATVTFSGVPEFGKTTQISLGGTPISHLNLIGDTAATIAKCFELLINAGSTGVWANASGTVLTITSRTMGAAGNGMTITVDAGSTVFTAASSGATTGGTDGQWRTDLAASPRINRAARDWSAAYFAALKTYGIDSTASFSMELQHGDDSVTAGIAQRYSNGEAVWLNTPALQTNFGPQSTAFWREVYAEMAALMTGAGVRPYLQFGEVQWWYFPNATSMPFYDAYTTSTFQAQYGRPMGVIASQNADPTAYTKECGFLRGLVGAFTDAVMAFVRQSNPTARFEVLYPPDVNDTALNTAVNLPVANWTPSVLDCLKTENFTYTGNRDLDKAWASVMLPMQLGFPPAKSSHLVGISEYTTPWAREQRIAAGQGLDCVVLFALDQFCLIGYAVRLGRGARRSLFQGS
ncbi:MAG: hypothetical protein JST11_29920 [Acidobacteria bacterium]|nr:hypothetical protein [Acidobacteriota bacterium]